MQRITLTILMALSCHVFAQTAGIEALSFEQHQPVRVPVIGGPCEGCEHVFFGMPANLFSQTRIASAQHAGEPMQLRGTVRSAQGEVVQGVVIYAYQTDHVGIYPKGQTPHGSLRAWAVTDAQGQYTFNTVRPGSYPGRNVPQHIHLHVLELGRFTYYINSVEFLDDPLLSNDYVSAIKSNRGGSGLSRPVKDDKGVWQVIRDIRLGQEIKDYPNDKK